MNEQITIRQRKVQREKIDAAIKLLELAKLETRTATPAEIAGSLAPALEIITKVNEFLISRPCISGDDIMDAIFAEKSEPPIPGECRQIISKA